MSRVEEHVEQHNVKLTSKRRKLVNDVIAKRDEQAAEVIKRVHKKGVDADPIRGRFAKTIEGKSATVEYEADSELRDTEQVPLLEEGGIEAFIRREVLPYAADAWYDAETAEDWLRDQLHSLLLQTAIPAYLEEIREDILALEKETEGILAQITVDISDKELTILLSQNGNIWRLTSNLIPG